MNGKTIKIGTRGSKLALYQANKVKDILEDNFKVLNFEIIIIKTKGDKILDVPLAKIGDKGLFTKELEVELLNKNIDLAVHSLKDLPTTFPEGMKLGAVLERADVRDVLISKNGKKLCDLEDGAIIGTSSLRRIAQILKFNPNFKIKDIRGNVDTRLRKLKEQDYDALVMAAAGIERLGYGKNITEYLDPEIVIPAVGQGAIAIEIHNEDEFTQNLLEKINHNPTYKAILVEREFLRAVQGGCQVPVGCHTEIHGDKISISAFISDIKGIEFLKTTETVELSEAVITARNIATKLLKNGGKIILNSIRESVQ